MFNRLGTFILNWYEIYITRRKRAREVVNDLDEEEVPKKRARPNNKMSEQFVIREPDELSYSMTSWLTPEVQTHSRRTDRTKKTLVGYPSYPRRSAETNKENSKSGGRLKRNMAGAADTIDLTEDEIVLLDCASPQRASSSRNVGAVRKPSADEDIQIIEPDPRIRMTFASNQYAIPRRASLSLDSSLGSSNLTINTVNRMDERKRFQQLIAMFDKFPRGRTTLGQSKQTGSRKACSLIRDIPLINLDTVVETDRAKEVLPSTLATSLATHDHIITSRYFNTKSLAQDINARYLERQRRALEEVRETRRRASLYREHNEKSVDAIEGRLRQYFSLTETVLVDDSEEEPALPELTVEMSAKIDRALVATPSSHILVEAFSLPISRRDMQTLAKLNWLNDEVINFYMSMLNERSNQGEHLKVYAFNTFFYPKLLSGGHAVLKRWTKKVDLFSKDLVVIPVHLGVHWCLAIIDFGRKEIRYYDSMGNPNNKCLEHLRQYIEAESRDKKKQPLDTIDWKLLNVTDIPQQMNGSDCGMFSCMFAEYLCRGAKITFTQADMPYFRRKMVYEILTAKLLPFW